MGGESPKRCPVEEGADLSLALESVDMKGQTSQELAEVFCVVVGGLFVWRAVRSRGREKLRRCAPIAYPLKAHGSGRGKKRSRRWEGQE